MTQEEFIEVLDEKGYSYEIEGDKIVVTHEGHVYFESLTSIPTGVEFKNGGSVLLNLLTSIPTGVEFNNEGPVNLRSLTSISPGVEFRNKERVYLKSLIGGFIDEWEGNIDGIDSKRLLNLMISKEMFI